MGHHTQKRPDRAILAALFSLLVMLVAGAGHERVQAQSGIERRILSITTATGAQEFIVEIANTEPDRQRGLMFRRNLGEREGMLFLFDQQEIITMWMKNTYISLDMIFINDERLVVDVARNAEPLSLDVIASKAPAKWVLELNAGSADRFGIRPGDRVHIKQK
jgi:hypothetical protein